ncbi:MAG: DUF3363 domain-containing protein [Geminicoccaceae bacterium]
MSATKILWGQITLVFTIVLVTLVGSTQLPSGRFAMIDDGIGFSLVPWRPALEQYVGRAISGVALPDGDVNWSLGRSRRLGR